MNVRYTLAGAAVLALAGAIGVWAQTTTVDAGSMAALTAEVRQLRVAVEESGRAQTQTQGLAVYLSAQQSRMVQINNQLQAVRSELDAALTEAQRLAGAVAAGQRELAPMADPRGRAEQQAMIQNFQQQALAANAAVDRLRTRESTLAQVLADEEARWTSLINRLEQAINNKK